jgi:hypothetical protein
MFLKVDSGIAVIFAIVKLNPLEEFSLYFVPYLC